MTVTARLCLSWLCAVCLAAPAAEYYRWVDEDGKTQFTQTPPPEGREAEKGRVRTAPSPAPSGGEDWLQDRQKTFKKLDKERTQAKEREAERRQLAEDNARDCDKVRRRLQVLNETPRIQVVDAEGERVMMTDEARQAEIGKMNELISAHCQ